MKLFILDATLADLPLVVSWRVEFLADHFPNTMKKLGPKGFASMKNALVGFYKKTMPDGSHVPCIAFLDENPVGFGALTIDVEEPSPQNPNGRIGHISSIYVREAYRHRGVASQILEHLMALAKKKSIRKLLLETRFTESPLYKEAGFVRFQDSLIYCKDNSTLVK